MYKQKICTDIHVSSWFWWSFDFSWSTSSESKLLLILWNLWISTDELAKNLGIILSQNIRNLEFGDLSSSVLNICVFEWISQQLLNRFAPVYNPVPHTPVQLVAFAKKTKKKKSKKKRTTTRGSCFEERLCWGSFMLHIWYGYRQSLLSVLCVHFVRISVCLPEA